jgi:putative ABC transport system permease protein
MRWIRETFHRLRTTWRRRQIDERLDDELSFHVEQATARYLEAGLPPDEARHRALVAFGGTERTREEARDETRWRPVEATARDLRLALRGMMRAPGFTAVTITTLALGMGAATAAFAIVNAVLFEPLPYRDADRLVIIDHSAPGIGVERDGASLALFHHYREHASSIQGLGLYSEGVHTLLTDAGGAERVRVAYAEAELFETLGVSPLLGDMFEPGRTLPGVSATTRVVQVMLTWDFWQSRYGGDVNVVGRQLWTGPPLSPTVAVVVAVLPRDLAFPGRDVQMWMRSGVPPDHRGNSVFDLSSFRLLARLAPGASVAQAEAELAAVLPRITPGITGASPAELEAARLRPIVTPLKDDVIAGAEPLLWAVFAGMAFMLVVACANVAGLFLTRAEQRDREIAVRRALGAGTVSVARLVACEAAVLVTVAAAGGWLLASSAVVALPSLVAIDLPRVDEVRLGRTALLFLTPVAAAVFGGIVLLTLSRWRVGTLRGLGGGLRVHTAGRRSARLQRGLVAMQVAVALVLVVGAALLLQSVRQLTQVPLGFTPENVLTVEVGLPGARATRHHAIYQEIIERVGALPGVAAVSAGSFAPLAGAEHEYPVVAGPPGTPGTDSDRPVPVKFVMPGYFDVLGMSIVEGARLPASGQIEGARPVWLSRTLARRLFPGGDAIGREVRRLEADGQDVAMWNPAKGAPEPVPPFVVAGIVAEAVEESPRRGASEILYVPIATPVIERSIMPVNVMLAIRTVGSADAVAGALPATIRSVDSAISTARIRTLDAIVASTTARESLLSGLLAGSAAVTLLLGMLGVYGVVTQAVRSRSAEIGVRMALGATATMIVAMMLRHAATLLLVGLAIGLPAAWWLSTFLRSLLFDVAPQDAVTIAGAVVLLLLTVLAAALVPSTRAGRIDPVKAMRAE